MVSKKRAKDLRLFVESYEWWLGEHCSLSPEDLAKQLVKFASAMELDYTSDEFKPFVEKWLEKHQS